MADVSPRFAVRTIPPGAALPNKFTVPIVAPINCSKIVIENTDASSAALVRSDPADTLTTKTIPAGVELTIDCRPDTGVAPAFKPGDIVAYVAASVVGQVGTLVVTFFR